MKTCDFSDKTIPKRELTIQRDLQFPYVQKQNFGSLDYYLGDSVNPWLDILSALKVKETDAAKPEQKGMCYT